MRRALVPIGGVLLAAAFAALSFGSSQTFTNNTGGPVAGIRITFSDMVWITGYDKTVFPAQDPAGVVSEITFSGGQLPSMGQFRVTWAEPYATVLSYAWLALSGSSSSSPSSATSSGQAAIAEGTDPVKTICDKRITINVSGYDVNIPYCANCLLDTPNPAIERAVIAVHGGDRHAAAMYEHVLEDARSAGRADEKTIVLAPQFLEEQDVRQHKLGSEMLYWSDWTWGDESHPPSELPGRVHISSFAVLDVILERLADRSLFPALRAIVIAGISSGGQFVQRFAAGSELEQKLAVQFGIKITYVVGAPASYLYFGGERGVEGTLDQFAVPPQSTQATCPRYDKYGYGLQGLNAYMAAVGAARIRAQYQQREVIYLIGSEDDDPSDTGMTGCGAMLQGSQRLERATIYYNYLQHYFGPGILSKHTEVVIHGVGHSYGLFSSACGMKYLFDYGGCAR